MIFIKTVSISLGISDQTHEENYIIYILSCIHVFLPRTFTLKGLLSSFFPAFSLSAEEGKHMEPVTDRQLLGGIACTKLV